MNIGKANSLEALGDRFFRIFGSRPVLTNNKYKVVKDGVVYNMTWYEMYGKIFNKKPIL